MIASKLELSFNDIKQLGKRTYIDSYAIHKIVYSLFPKKEKTSSRKFLFDEYPNGVHGNKNKAVLILSQEHPLQPEVGSIHSKEIPPSLFEYQYYRFRVRINPSRRIKGMRNPVPVLGYQELLKWFCNKSTQYGFEVTPEHVQISDIGAVQIKKREHTIVHNSATFSGVLKVIDKKVLQDTFIHGMGRAKAYGFGLLHLVPLQRENNL